MGVPDLSWVLAFCAPEGAPNRAGSFVAKLFHFVQARLIQRVMHLLREEEGERIACIVFDGLSVANQARHGDGGPTAVCRACEGEALGPFFYCTRRTHTPRKTHATTHTHTHTRTHTHVASFFMLLVVVLLVLLTLALLVLLAGSW